MKILSLLKLAEDAAYLAEGQRNYLGAIQNPKTFEKNFAALDQQHRGAYAFVAFHPAADKHVVEYISEGSLGDDAGSHILALFLEGDDVPQTPREVRPSDPLLGVKLSLEEHPAYELANKFFQGEARPQFPGLVFFDRLLEPATSIYVVLEGTSKEQLRAHCRKVFDAANLSVERAKDDGNPSSWRIDFDRFAGRLVEVDVSYRRAGEKGVRSVAFLAGAWIKKNIGSIVVAIPKLVIPRIGKA